MTRYKSTTLSLIKDSDAVFTMHSQSMSKLHYIFMRQTPFRHAMHPGFKKWWNMLRPGYTLPSERRLAGEILDIVHKKAIKGQKNSVWRNCDDESWCME